MERAKLIRYTKHPRYRYLDEYVYKCIDCGEEFTRATNAKNINPYCGKCYRKRETEKQRERNKRKRNNEIIAELEKLKAKMEIRVKHNNDLENYDIATGLSMALGILENHISELKGENKDFDHEKFYEFLLNVINPNEMEKYRSMFLSSGEIVN